MTATDVCCACGRTMPPGQLKLAWVRPGRNPTGRREYRDRQTCLFWKQAP